MYARYFINGKISLTSLIAGVLRFYDVMCKCISWNHYKLDKFNKYSPPGLVINKGWYTQMMPLKYELHSVLFLEWYWSCPLSYDNNRRWTTWWIQGMMTRPQANYCNTKWFLLSLIVLIPGYSVQLIHCGQPCLRSQHEWMDLPSLVLSPALRTECWNFYYMARYASRCDLTEI